MQNYPREDLVFIDESLFKERTGWRMKARALIGKEARYSTDINQGKTFSILPAIDIDGYLECTGIKEGYFNRDDLLAWLEHLLLLALAEKYGSKPIVIVLDNCSTHVAPAIVNMIQSAGHIIKYLPPYSPDFNLIKLTFSVLKPWVRRHYIKRRREHERFDHFLRMATDESGCDRFAAK
jgi:transposase